MLIISRHEDECIYIGNDIRITVTGISPHQVRIGITAPKEVHVLRGELRTAKKATEEGSHESLHGVNQKGKA